jgi:hypothetical protein
MLRRLIVLCAAAMLGLVLSGCEASGGGWIQSRLVPGARATFGFHIVTDLDTGTSSFSGAYHDPQGMGSNGEVVRVDFKGTGVLHEGPPPPGAPPNVRGGCLLGMPTYESINPRAPGTGQLELVVCDMDGNGPSTGDYILLQVQPPPLGGPYSGYQNGGFLQGGNITVKP